MNLALLSIWILYGIKKVFSHDSDPDLEQKCLQAHNEYRVRHGAEKLAWSRELATEAQNWANHLAAIDQMERDPLTNLGENIFYMYGGDPKEACQRAVENWYQEVKNYDFKTPHEDPSTGHFSQVVWKKTKQLGVGEAQSKSGNFFLVARYHPKGNMEGAFNDNVDCVMDVRLSVDPGAEGKITKPANETPAVVEDSSTTTTAPPSTTIPTTIPAVTTTSPQATLFNGSVSSEFATETSNTSNTAALQPISQAIAMNQTDLGDGKTGANATTKQSSDPAEPPKKGKDFRVEIRFPNLEYKANMAYPNYEEFEAVKRNVTSAIYEEYLDFEEVQLMALRNGSIIATLGMIFKKTGPGHLDILTSTLGTGMLGPFAVSPTYVTAVTLPDGYLKLTLPPQPPVTGSCPQPCSNPQHCYHTGCHVDCCSFHPTSHHPQQHYHPQPAPTAAPTCPGHCDVNCYPQCTTDCCVAKPVQPAIPAPVVAPVPAVAPALPPPTPYYQGYSCPASCHFSCFPECTPDCCGNPVVSAQCPAQCSNLCAPTCTENCCSARKSDIHSFGKSGYLHQNSKGLPSFSAFAQARPLTNKIAYSYGTKFGNLRHPIYGQQLSAKRDYGNKGGSFVRDRQFRMSAKRGNGHGTKARTSRNPAVQHGSFISKGSRLENLGGQILTGRQAARMRPEVEPLDIKFAYRYGNRLLIPVDLRPTYTNELRQKFISVPAYKRNLGHIKNKKRRSQ